MDIFETGFLVIVPLGLVLVMFGMGRVAKLDYAQQWLVVRWHPPFNLDGRKEVV